VSRNPRPKGLLTRYLFTDYFHSHVEGISNLAATLLSLNRREEAEQYWLKSVKLRPSYFEAVEHLIGLLCAEHRGLEAVGIIEFVERSLRISGLEAPEDEGSTRDCNQFTQRKHHQRQSSNEAAGYWPPDSKMALAEGITEGESVNASGFGSSGYAIPGFENGRMLALVHAKGNMLYALGDVAGAEHAFEDAVLISAGRRVQGIQGLIQKILNVLSISEGGDSRERKPLTASPLLLPPDKALQTAKLAFARHGELPGLRHVPEGIAKNAAISTTSNSLLSLAKIFQDGMSNTQTLKVPRRPSGVGDILALYYLSLSLQPSPSTANNVGILLASIQQTASTPSTITNDKPSIPTIPGVVPGSGVALALAYYNYGLNLDSGHAHLYTNLGSLLKDIGQLTAAIKMYEKAVACDSNFDIGKLLAVSQVQARY
jgi:tetratricopeptide (TPR) repeat protein